MTTKRSQPPKHPLIVLQPTQLARTNLGAVRSFSKSTSKRRRQRQQEQLEQQLQQEQSRQEQMRRTALVTALAVPVTLAVWALASYILGNQKVAKNKAMRNEFVEKYSNQQLQDSPPLFVCIVRQTSLATNHCLTGVRIGDLVEVLEEGVGPNGEYNTCRLVPRQSENNTNDDDMTQNNNVEIYGWFPTRGLQKYNDYVAMTTTMTQTTTAMSSNAKTDDSNANKE